MANEPVEHKYHLVNPSIWPFSTSFALLFVTFGAVMLMHEHSAIGYATFFPGLAILLYSMYGWWRDVIIEGRQDKAHTSPVQTGLKFGMILFIISEIAFFGVFFTSFFKSSISPVGILDGFWAGEAMNWPPEGIKTLDAWNLPFMNTLILLLSGTTVTWAHHAILENNQKDVKEALLYTVLLGVFFLGMQALEYSHASFKFTDGIYPSNFYMATGFHGAHVLIGTLFLAVCYFRAKKNHFIKEENHLGFEFAAWYWHFVDVVWLFLFIFVYILGS